MSGRLILYIVAELFCFIVEINILINLSVAAPELVFYKMIIKETVCLYNYPLSLLTIMSPSQSQIITSDLNCPVDSSSEEISQEIESTAKRNDATTLKAKREPVGLREPGIDKSMKINLGDMEHFKLQKQIEKFYSTLGVVFGLEVRYFEICRKISFF